MAAYYNEFDKHAAAWLRELIKAGLIANGEVDERSIADVRPDDLRGFTQCHFFAGIGGWSYALRLAGWPDDRPVWTGSCPCQPFSAAGKGHGEADPRDLWPAWVRLIRECQPTTIFGEQVEGAAKGGWLDRLCADLEGEKYGVGAVVLGAHSVGAPHIRQRLYFVAESLHAERRPLHVSRAHRCDGPDDGRAQAHGLFGARGEVCEVADAEAAGSPCRGRGSVLSQPCAESGTGELADALSTGRAEGPAVARDGQITGRGSAGELAISKRRRCEGPAVHVSERGPRQAVSGVAGTSASGELGHADDTRSQGREREPERTGERASRAASVAGDSALAMSDMRELELAKLAGMPLVPHHQTFWSACDWLPCRDGKYRPVESGSFPLAHGVPARVGRLRGYGNAIVPQVAAAFIAAYLEIT